MQSRPIGAPYSGPSSRPESGRVGDRSGHGARDHAIVMLDPSGLIVGWNAGAQQITGHVPAEVLGQSFQLFYPSDEIAAEQPRAHLAQAAEVGHVQHAGWRLRKDGSRWWAATALTALYDDAGELRALGTVIRAVIPGGDPAPPDDMAPDDMAPDGMAPDGEEPEGVQQLLDSVLSHPIVMLDAEGTVIAWNAGAERITGYSAPRRAKALSSSSTPPTRSRPARRSSTWPRPSLPVTSSTRAGGSARTAVTSGPTWC